MSRFIGDSRFKYYKHYVMTQEGCTKLLFKSSNSRYVNEVFRILYGLKEMTKNASCSF